MLARIAHPALLLLGFIVLAPLAQAEEFKVTAKLIRPANPEERIDGLAFRGKEVQVEFIYDPKDKSLSGNALLTGFFDQPGKSLLFEGNTKPLTSEATEDKTFSVKMPVFAQENEMTFTSIDVAGGISKEKIKVVIPEFSSLLAEHSEELPPYAFKSRWTLTPTVGVSLVSYHQNGARETGELALTPALSIRFDASPKEAFSQALTPLIGDIELAANYHSWTFGLTPSTAQAIQVLEVNLRGGWTIPKIPKPWTLRLVVGAYYATMIIPSGGYGFLNVSGPELYPTASVTIRKWHTIGAYFQFSPVTNGINFLGLDTRQISFGTSYAYALPYAHRKHRLVATVDASNMQINVSPNLVNLSSYTGSLSYQVQF